MGVSQGVVPYGEPVASTVQIDTCYTRISYMEVYPANKKMPFKDSKKCIANVVGL